MNYTDVTPPPPKKKNQEQLKKKLYSFFSLELQKTSIYQITMYAIPRFLGRILSSMTPWGPGGLR